MKGKRVCLLDRLVRLGEGSESWRHRLSSKNLKKRGALGSKDKKNNQKDGAHRKGGQLLQERISKRGLNGRRKRRVKKSGNFAAKNRRIATYRREQGFKKEKTTYTSN